MFRKQRPQSHVVRSNDRFMWTNSPISWNLQSQHHSQTHLSRRLCQSSVVQSLRRQTRIYRIL